jgi:hypothetical protein
VFVAAVLRCYVSHVGVESWLDDVPVRYSQWSRMCTCSTAANDLGSEGPFRLVLSLTLVVLGSSTNVGSGEDLLRGHGQGLNPKEATPDMVVTKVTGRR